MQINSVAIPLDQSSTTGSSSSSNPVQSTDSMFMKLLTAQLQNQSPLDPVDPMQFTSQLVEFNMLDQLTQINTELQQSLGSANSGSTPAANSGGN